MIQHSHRPLGFLIGWNSWWIFFLGGGFLPRWKTLLTTADTMPRTRYLLAQHHPYPLGDQVTAHLGAFFCNGHTHGHTYGHTLTENWTTQCCLFVTNWQKTELRSVVYLWPTDKKLNCSVLSICHQLTENWTAQCCLFVTDWQKTELLSVVYLWPTDRKLLFTLLSVSPTESTKLFAAQDLEGEAREDDMDFFVPGAWERKKTTLELEDNTELLKWEWR